MRDHGAQTVAELEQRERERTGAKKLKVGYNKVFGYYIDIPNSAGITELPEDYIRKQTLVSSERYFTHELKELENTLLTARERIAELEYQLFNEVRQLVAEIVFDESTGLPVPQMGDAVMMTDDSGNPIFDGVVLRRSAGSEETSMSFTCFDRGIYCRRNDGTYKFRARSAPTMRSLLSRCRRPA